MVGSNSASEALIDQFVDAFNARDLHRLTALLLDNSTAEVKGMGTSYGRKPISESSLYYSLFLEKGEPRAERHRFDDEDFVVFLVQRSRRSYEERGSRGFAA